MRADGRVGPSARLALHWAASHMLLPHFSTECVELVMAHVYLQPLPYPTPTSYFTALQRSHTRTCCVMF